MNESVSTNRQQILLILGADKKFFFIFSSLMSPNKLLAVSFWSVILNCIFRKEELTTA